MHDNEEDVNNSLKNIYQKMCTELKNTIVLPKDFIDTENLKTLKNNDNIIPKNFASLMKIWRNLVRNVLIDDRKMVDYPKHIIANKIISNYPKEAAENNVGKQILMLGIMRELNDSKLILLETISKEKGDSSNELAALKTQLAELQATKNNYDAATTQMKKEKEDLEKEIAKIKNDQEDKDKGLYELLATLRNTE